MQQADVRRITNFAGQTNATVYGQLLTAGTDAYTTTEKQLSLSGHADAKLTRIF